MQSGNEDMGPQVEKAYGQMQSGNEDLGPQVEENDQHTHRNLMQEYHEKYTKDVQNIKVCSSCCGKLTEQR